MINKNYISMPFKKFAETFPALLDNFPPAIVSDFLSDDKYIVHLTDHSIEVGYSEDEWTD